MDLNPGDVLCTECDGEGAIHSSHPDGASMVCDKCKGYGKLDWIENVTGVKDTPFTIYKKKLKAMNKQIDPNSMFMTGEMVTLFDREIFGEGIFKDIINEIEKD